MKDLVDMRIAEKYLKELIDHEGKLANGAVLPLGILRLALDLREAREKIAELESTLALREASPPKPRAPQQQRRLHVVEEIATGKKVDFRA